MAITSLYFPRSLREPLAHRSRDHGELDQAMALFDEGRPLAAVERALASLLEPGIVIDLAHTPLCIVQGTARVHVSLHDDRLRARAGLVRLDEGGNAVAVLRYFLSTVASTGQLHQPRLHDDGTVTLGFEEHLSLLHPAKLIEAVQKLAREAMLHDVWLAQRFGVTMLDREPVQPLPEAQLQQACAIWDRHWQAVEELLTEINRRRSTDLLNRVSSYVRNQIEDVLPIQGELYEMLADAEQDFGDRDETFAKRVAALTRCVRQARDCPHAELRASLGNARYMLNPLDEGSPAALTRILDGRHRSQAISDYDAAGRFLESALFQAVDFQHLLTAYTWPHEVERALRDALHGASGIPLRDAARDLKAAAQAIVRTHGRAGQSNAEDDA